MRLKEMIVSSISFIGDAQFSAFETIDQFVFKVNQESINSN
jgi:hypothetical protein